LLGACSVATASVEQTPAITTATPAGATSTLPSTPAVAPTPSSTPSSTVEAGGAVDEVPLYDPDLLRSDVDCSRDFVTSGGGEDFPEAFTAAHYVADGILGAVCMGDEDERLLDAWYWLRIVAPAEDLADLILFAGYDAESDLLAYVEPLSARDGSISFQMTLNLDAAVVDDVELALTMAHEFTHVFTGTTRDLDRSVSPEACTTYHGGEGCYRPGSYIARWTEAFWGDWIDEVHPDSANEDEASEARCQADSSFLGAYAASNPEEDFAETFSAYVYGVPVDAPGLLAKMEFMDSDPSLRKYRERAEAVGLTSFPNLFDGCGY
ncbi:MAG: hypothetical protein O2888_05535, partial [Chloroflexi bacterium]|nr:hypothetical protein [Chloroflexota bacterium]